MQLQHILLLFGQRYNPSIHAGVARHAAKMRWHLSMLIHPGDRKLKGLSGLQGVILADRFEEPVVESVVASGLPVVCLSPDPERYAGARVCADNRAIGEMAAGYLLERRFCHFAYHGDSTTASRVRRDAFVSVLKKRGLRCRLIKGRPASQDVSAALDWEAEMRAIHAGLKDLPVPAAVFCFNDIQASRLLDAALQLGRRVPEEISILGVDDDRLICENTAVPLSSVRHPLEDLGLRGAELLEDIMAGRAAPAAREFLPPLGVTTRRSTECFAVEHPVLQAILLHLDRNHHRALLDLNEVAIAAGVSPRTVQLLLKAHLNSTMTDEVQRRRLVHAQRLLSVGDLPVADIAALTGFASATYFHQAFKRHTGMTPRTYRQRCRDTEGN